MTDVARNPAKPCVTIGFVAKEKFHLAASALETLLATLPAPETIPCEVIVVDCNTPVRYRAQLADVMARWSRVNFRVVSSERFLQPNQARNLVARHARHDYMAFVENDSFVPAGWLEAMLEVCLTYPKGCVVFPEMFEGPADRGLPHVDVAITHIVTRREKGRVIREFVRDESALTRHLHPRCQVVDASEAHVLLCSREVFNRFGGFDERISTREHCDLALSLHEVGIPLIVNGHVRASFYPAPPVQPDERGFFRFVWDVGAARRSLEHLTEKWNLVNFPSSLGFVRSQAFRTHHLGWRAFAAARRRLSLLGKFFDDKPISSPSPGRKAPRN